MFIFLVEIKFLKMSTNSIISTEDLKNLYVLDEGLFSLIFPKVIYFLNGFQNGSFCP